MSGFAKNTFRVKKEVYLDPPSMITVRVKCLLFRGRLSSINSTDPSDVYRLCQKVRYRDIEVEDEN